MLLIYIIGIAAIPIKTSIDMIKTINNVDIYLQHNNISNLRLCIEKLNDSIIKSLRRFSVGHKVGVQQKNVFWKDFHYIMGKNKHIGEDYIN